MMRVMIRKHYKESHKNAKVRDIEVEIPEQMMATIKATIDQVFAKTDTDGVTTFFLHSCVCVCVCVLCCVVLCCVICVEELLCSGLVCYERSS